MRSPITLPIPGMPSVDHLDESIIAATVPLPANDYTTLNNI